MGNENLNPKVTIFMSVLNGSVYLKNSLDSINIQSYNNIEVYLYDHGSTDNTWNIIQKFNCNFPCAKKHFDRTEEDFKYTCARMGNDAIKECTGDIFCWIACDDVLLNNFILNNVIQYINNPQMEIWHSPIWWYDPRNGVKNRLERFKKPNAWNYNPNTLKKEMIKRSVINTPSIFLKPKVAKDVGYWDGKYCDCGDYEFYMRVIDKGYYIYPIQKFLGMFYGFHVGQCTNEIFLKKDGYPIKELQENYKKKWKL